ncbi:MAG: hypothetical protein ACPL6D_13845 [Thermodesulfobacteriota bacterium]
MPFLVRNLISNFLRHPPQSFSGFSKAQHQMLSGIHQTVFLNQWGLPEIQLSLDRMEGFFELGSISLKDVSGEGNLHSVWIYESKDKILFFKRGRLISHFKWSDFKQRWRVSKDMTGLKIPYKTLQPRSKLLSLLS